MGSKLLLADDSVTIQKVVELTLADEEYDITMVSDGASAFQKAEEINPDLILADIVMPELNGYELCERIRRTPSLAQTPVLLLSSTFETYDETRGQSVGADDHIIKPFESEELTQKIRNLLARKSSAAESAAVPQEAAAVPDAGDAVELSSETPILLGSDAIEEEAFEFELTDEFMDQAEEMFEDTEETSFDEGAETLPELEELADEQSLGELDSLMASEGLEDVSGKADEAAVVDDIPGIGTYAEKTDTYGRTMGAGIFADSSGAETEEIDRELMEEEEVNLYEIPDEFAETETIMQTGPLGEEGVFKIEATPGDLIDEFMATEEIGDGSDEADHGAQELTEAEILDAVEEPSLEEEDLELGAAAESFWETDEIGKTAGMGETVEAEGPPLEESTAVSWGAGTAAATGVAAAATGMGEKAAAPVTEPASAAAVDEETVRRIVSEMVDEKAAEIIERVAWEVIPDLAEVLIKQEIRRIQQEVESS